MEYIAYFQKLFAGGEVNIGESSLSLQLDKDV